MDRIEFIEELQEELSELKTERANLTAKASKAYRSTRAYFLEELNKNSSDTCLDSFGMLSGAATYGYSDSRKSEYSKEVIVGLSAEISSVKEEIRELETQILTHNLNSIKPLLKEILND